MRIVEAFHFCPRCGQDNLERRSDNGFHCSACEFHFHFNNGAAVGVLIVNTEGLVLLLRRAKNPGKGKWGIPGGFVEMQETAEEAVTREVLEETGLHITNPRYLASFPNPYEYREHLYWIMDAFFVCEAPPGEVVNAPDEVTESAFVPLDELNLDDVAFISNRQVLELYREQRAQKLGT